MTGGPSRWNHAKFAELVELICSDKAAGIVGRFQADLGQRFLGSRDQARRDAHIVKSTAGMLGFEGLTEAAVAVERVDAGGDVDGAIRALLDETSKVIQLLARWRHAPQAL